MSSREDVQVDGECFQLVVCLRDRAHQGLPSVTVLREGSEIGYLTWAGKVINRVQVDKPWRRRGLASAMYRRALLEQPELRHDDLDQLSASGKSWARAVGGNNAP